MSSEVVVLDVGATKINAAYVADGRVSERIRHEEPLAGYDRDTRVVAALVDTVAGTRSPSAAGIALAGFMTPDRRQTVTTLLPGWAGHDLVADLTHLLGLPVVIENDANAAVWGEYVSCTPRPDPLMMLTLGSGVGGGIVLNDSLVVGSHGVAGELGHVLVDPAGYPCGCGSRGCLEQYASGRSLLDCYRRLLRGEDPAPFNRLPLPGLPPNERRQLEASFAADLAHGNEAAAVALQQLGEAVGAACDRLARVLDPEMVLIGGGLASIGAPLLEAVCAGFNRASAHLRTELRTRFELSRLGEDGALLGVADLVEVRMGRHMVVPGGGRTE